MQVELDERKMRILKAIIQNYLETGEPVGSRTISKFSDLQLSSATIRNEMSDLEELGFIIQPHTSAGRIPSDKGYRLYVDQLMQESEAKDRELTEMKDFIIQKVDRVENVLKQMAKLLANNTQYAAMITGPELHHNKLKFIQLSKMDTGKLLAVIVVEGNIIKNTILDIEEDLTEEAMLNLNILLNTTLNGLTIEQITLGAINRMKEQAGAYSGLIQKVLDAVAEAIQIDDDMQIYTSGATNIFKYPELSDGEKASKLLSTLEEKQQLQELIASHLEGEGKNEIQVYIGDETPVQTMKDCSVVTASYDLGEGLHGTIGIIGPKRMDYEHVVSTLRTLMAQLDTVFRKK